MTKKISSGVQVGDTEQAIGKNLIKYDEISLN